MNPTVMPQVTSVSSQFDLVSLLLLLFFIVFLIVSIVVGFLVFIIFKKTKEREARSLNSILLQVSVSRNNEVKIDAMEQLFSSLFAIKKGAGFVKQLHMQPLISFEIVARSEDIRFYVWTYKSLQDLVEKQIHGAYPDADISEVPEYNIFTKEGRVAYKSLQLKKDNFYPIKTFKDLPTDPLAAITSSMAKMGKTEAAAIQMIVAPSEGPWKDAGKAYIKETKKNESNPEKASYGVPAKTLEAVENKISKPGFDVSLRIVVVSDTDEAAKQHLDNLSTAFSQFDGEFNGLGSRTIRRKSAFVEDFIYRYMPMFDVWGNHTSVMNSEELATVFHFPNKLITTPHIQWLIAKNAPAPGQIPTEGLFLGTNIFRGVKRDIHIGDADRLRHTYIIGKTGTGKTKYLLELMKQDIKNGKGLCFIDPHGDGVEELLQFIPPERAEDVIYFRPSDIERPMGLNLLEAKTEDQKHFVTTSVINLMYKLFDPYKTGIVGPRFEHAVRNAMLTVMSEPGNTFIEVMRALTDMNYVREILPKVEDPIVRRYWTDQIAQTSDFHKSETLDYITSKFGRFVTNKMIRNLIGQSESSFNFRKIMDEGKILLINLSKGEIGEENSNFLGLILVPRILMAAMTRTDIPEEERRDFFLYVDEFQNFATPDFAQILSEARKYKLALVVANQFVGQIDTEIKDAIFGNVGTIICYKVGVDDASYLARQFSPIFNEEDLQGIARYHVYIKTLVNNEGVLPFSMSIEKDQSEIKKMKNPEVARIIKEMSRIKYGRDVRLVEAEIGRRARL